MLEAIVGSKNRVKVLRELFRRDGLSGRQLAKQAGLGPSAGKESLEELARTGLVLSTQERGRRLHELNRSHFLTAPLGRLFAEEARLSQRVADDLRRALRTQANAELLCLGIAADSQVTLATAPCLPQGAPCLAALTRQLHTLYGLRLARCVANPAAIPATERVWILPRSPDPAVPLGEEARARALKFFRVPQAAVREEKPLSGP